MGWMEIISFAGSGIFSAVMTLLAEQREYAHKERLAALKAAEEQETFTQNARQFKAGWVRPAIALIAVFFIIAYPMLVATFSDVPIFIAEKYLDGGFWPFIEAQEKTRYAKLPGLVITEMHVSLMFAVTGFYLGNRISKR